MHTLRTILAALAIAGILAACGGSGDGWTQHERDQLDATVYSIDGVTATQARCMIDYIVDHWSSAEVQDGAGHERAHGREAGLACR